MYRSNVINRLRITSSRWVAVAALAGLAGALPVSAQPAGSADLEEMRRRVSVFGGVLREALSLDERRTLFSPRGAQVKGHYLAGQGVVMELTAPLPMGRRGFGLRRLDDVVTALEQQLDNAGEVTGALVQRPDFDAMRQSMALSLRRDAVGEYYRDLMEQLSELDGAATDNAVRLAEEAAGALQRMSDVDGTSLQQWQQELDALKEQLGEHLQRVADLREAVRNEAGDAELADELRQSWEDGLAELRAQWPALRDRARAAAEEIRQRSQQLREQEHREWRAEVAEFEQRLYDVLCRYGATVSVPDGEHITVVLRGLGEAGDDGAGPADRIHVVGEDALRRCQRGEMDVAALRDSARRYSF